MHLPEAHEEPTVSPLRDQTLFSPSPGTHLADCSADTAKLLVGIFDEDKAETEVFSTEDGPVTYKQVRGKPHIDKAPPMLLIRYP